jgi:formylglycine-generating enzyme required for sulfatase activity
MVLIPAGSFTMGDSLDGDVNALPLHTNQISAFYMDRTEVTKALWDEVRVWAVTNGYDLGSVGAGKAANHPVQSVNWYDVVKWCNARSQKEGRTPAYYISAAQTTVYRTGQVDVQNDWVRWTAGYRLPTEAEWEKAARGGASGRRFPWADADTITHSRANYGSTTNYAYDISPTRGGHPTFTTNAQPSTSPVGYFAPNGYGLYDMAGSVFEWCWDWSGSYSSGSQTDPRGPESGSNRVLRGGSWSSSAIDCRAADRSDYDPTHGDYGLGFRAVLPPGQP